MAKKEIDEMSHEQMVNTVIGIHFNQKPEALKRMTLGICNEVYSVRLSDQDVIVRLSLYDRFLKGSSQNIPTLKNLGIPVPEILAEDYSRTEVPMAYQIQSKLAGVDLGEVIQTLDDGQLKSIAAQVANVFRKLSVIHATDTFGDYPPAEGEKNYDTWTERVKAWVDEAVQRGEKTGVMDVEIKEILDYLLLQNARYFHSVKPVLYFPDITSKNVMVSNGTFSGLVDLDTLSQGDPLEAVGRIKTSWPNTHHGDFYTKAVMDSMELNEEQKNMVTAYALLHAILWACENGVQFNQNTTAIVDQEKLARDKKRIQLLHQEMQLSKSYD